MCFLISYKRPRPRIAKKNIPVLKLYLTSDSTEYDYVSPFQYAKVIKGLQEEVQLRPLVTLHNSFIREGYHSFHHLIIHIYNQNYSSDMIIVRCWIPRGAEYYYNPEYKEYVSSFLVVGKELAFDSVDQLKHFRVPPKGLI